MDEENNQIQPAQRQDIRRNSVPDEDGRSVTFVPRTLSPERLEALRQFLASASADDIAAVRVAFGDMPDVLMSIGLEIGKEF